MNETERNWWLTIDIVLFDQCDKRTIIIAI